MNRKGQALVEFVLILPVFILILLAVIDFGNIIIAKNKLENSSTDIIRMIKNEEKVDDIYSEFNIDITDYKEGYKRIVISSNVKVNTPLLDKILGNPCKITTERVIPYE